MKTPAKRPAFESPGDLVRPVGYDPDMSRPAAISAGAGLVMLRVLAGLLWLVALAFNWGDIARSLDLALDGVSLTDDEKALGLAVILTIGGIATLGEGVLAVLIYRGHNWARGLIATEDRQRIAGWSKRRRRRL